MTTFALRSRAAGGPAIAGPLLNGPAPAWAALFLNVLTVLGTGFLGLLPQSAGKMIAQCMVVVALLLAVLANPRMVVRPNAFLALLTAMAVFALMVSIHSQFLVGSTYRAFRLLLFVAVLWLLTPWWGRSDVPLLRAHLLCQRIIIGSAWLGALLAPGKAFAFEGRLSDVLWPMTPPAVAHYAAVLLGCSVVLWFCGVVTGRGLAATVAAAGAALIATHTRTALLGLAVGLVVAGGSLFLGNARVRRTAAVTLLTSVAAWIAFAPLIVSWLARGQSEQQLADLTGRANVWAAIAHTRFSTMQQLFGLGLGNKSFNGLAIDSNWVATRLELGRVGVAIVVSFLLVLLFAAVTKPAGPRRAIALFLIAYCVASSFTETGLGDASPYLLDLAVAASLLASQPRFPWPQRGLKQRRPTTPDGRDRNEDARG